VTTRRQAVAAAVGVGVAAFAPGSAVAASDTDREPLAALVAYQQEVVFRYEVALAKARLTHSRRAALTRFEREAAQAAAALRSALKAQGGTPAPAPDPATAPPQAQPGLHGFVADLIAVEEAAVASFYDAMQTLQDPRHLSGSAALMAQAGRRLVVLRSLAGEPLLPRNFETGAA
jgi:hypothetical protein